jgi:hypothetical protein
VRHSILSEKNSQKKINKQILLRIYSIKKVAAKVATFLIPNTMVRVHKNSNSLLHLISLELRTNNQFTVAAASLSASGSA